MVLIESLFELEAFKKKNIRLVMNPTYMFCLIWSSFAW